MVTIDDARAVASTLPRSYEAVVRDEMRLRVARIVYVAFSPDETIMGFAFPKEERDALVAITRSITIRGSARRPSAGMPSDLGVLRGRYWFRTSDLCRVKAALSR